LERGGLVQDSKINSPMSALGQKQTLRPVQSMSALPPKADIGTQPRDVRFVPSGREHVQQNPQSKTSLFDHLVGAACGNVRFVPKADSCAAAID
jgi:hypothetical protein